MKLGLGGIMWGKLWTSPFCPDPFFNISAPYPSKPIMAFNIMSYFRDYLHHFYTGYIIVKRVVQCHACSASSALNKQHSVIVIYHLMH